MRKILFALLVMSVAFVSCAKSPKEKAIKLIEATSSDYVAPPVFVFNYDVEPIIDKKDNDIVGYEMQYQMTVGETVLNRQAIFNKEMSVITDQKVVIDEAPGELMEQETVTLE